VKGFRVDLDIKENGSFCTLKLKGKFTLGEPVNQFDCALRNALSNGHINLIFDLEAVPYLDSSAIGALANSLRASSKVGGSVKLVKPASFVLKTLKMVGLIDLFEIFESEEEAAAANTGS
jgi:anti-sigma B factor antagonist